MLRRAIVGLAAGAIVLLVAFAVVGGLALVLSGVGDVDGSRASGYVAIAVLLLLAIDLICLLLAVAIDAGSRPGDSPSSARE